MQQLEGQIAIVTGAASPIGTAISNRLHNVPAKGFYDISPGSYFGIYKPDTFWFDETRR